MPALPASPARQRRIGSGVEPLRPAQRAEQNTMREPRAGDLQSVRPAATHQLVANDKHLQQVEQAFKFTITELTEGREQHRMDLLGAQKLEIFHTLSSFLRVFGPQRVIGYLKVSILLRSREKIPGYLYRSGPRRYAVLEASEQLQRLDAAIPRCPPHLKEVVRLDIGKISCHLGPSHLHIPKHSRVTRSSKEMILCEVKDA